MLLLVAACSDATEPAAPEIDRLVVVDGTEVVTMDPAGDDRVTVGADVAGTPFQPIWSHDGASVAYSFSSSEGEFGLAVGDAATGTAATVTAPTNVFYMMWSPAGDRVAALRNHEEGGVALDLVATGESGVSRELVDDGDSYYLSWSPDGEDVAVHVGAGRFELFSEGEFESLDDAPGSYQAPMWIDDSIYGIAADGDRRTLTRYGRDGESEELVEVSGPTSFHISPDGERVALQSLGTGDVIEAGIRSASADGDPVPPNGVYVVDLDSGEATQVHGDLVTGFWWSPDGERLLVLHLPEGSTNRFDWFVWEDGTVTKGPTFAPTGGWIQDFIPFLDQYNRGMTPWSPDSTSIAFPGTVEDEGGIWVAEVGADAEGDPEKVSDGTWVAWSWS
jgi:Tol biopolymer transport system component